MRAVIGAAAASTVLCLVGWVVYNASGLQEYDEHDTGVALREVAEPGDTLVVYGGRADLQLESGLSSPYAYLWSLPMRTLDPDLAELRRAGRRPGPADLDRRVGGVPALGRAATAAGSRGSSQDALRPRTAPAAATGRSGCSAASTGPTRSRTATARASSSARDRETTLTRPYRYGRVSEVEWCGQ